MKPEQILNRLGLSANILIVILLLVIIYYLHLINENLILERFSIGAQEADQMSESEFLERAAAIVSGNTPARDDFVGIEHGGVRPGYQAPVRQQVQGVAAQAQAQAQTAAARAAAQAQQAQTAQAQQAQTAAARAAAQAQQAAVGPGD